MENSTYSPSKSFNFKYLNNLFFVIIVLCQSSYGQQYRNAKAYIVDFGKNELFVKEALMEYSASIVNADLEDRISDNLTRLYIKLEAINNNLIQNDHGVNGDLDLRNAFIKLNQETISLLKNKSLKLNDYKYQSTLDYPEIISNFSYKESGISNYYKEILSYENRKKEFGLKYKIQIRYFNKKNVFEYDAYQSFIYYRLNVLDEKLIELFKSNSIENVKKCMDYITQIGQESLLRTDAYKNDFIDTSLNDANIDFIHFIMDQKEKILPFYTNYMNALNNFNTIKQKNIENSSAISNEEYNVAVRNYNKAKNEFFDTLYAIQTTKQNLLLKWQVTNSNFLKHNVEFENLYEKFTKTN
jgi:hypothetical protein